ncbi:hypothetical protein ACSNOK_27510 [Streptomyces sp. URMC 126]|uniref:hypothetical protein n=1 Tax=Streptomyces sp. URMC 126 TaxID=3423401 RepID=UPI003F1D5C6F
MRGHAGRAAAGAWYGRLLFLAALLLGLVTMHTLGHPTGHTGRGTEPATGTSVSTPASTAAGALLGRHGDGPGAHQPEAGSPVAHRNTPTGSPASHTSPTTPHHPQPDLNPSSVCLAVLGAGWAVVLLLLASAVLRRPAGRAAGAGPRALGAHALWPVPPPPRRKALARLSVLRV